MADRLKTRISTKGQVILPKAIREAMNWQAGRELTVEKTADGVLLRQVPVFAPTRPEDVFGCLKYAGPPISVEDMNKAIEIEVKRRHARGRY